MIWWALILVIQYYDLETYYMEEKYDRDSICISDLNIDFYNFISLFALTFQLLLRTHISSNLNSVWSNFPKTSKFVKNTPLYVVFSTLSSLIGNCVVKHLGLESRCYSILKRRTRKRISTSVFLDNVYHPFFCASLKYQQTDALLVKDELKQRLVIYNIVFYQSSSCNAHKLSK